MYVLCLHRSELTFFFLPGHMYGVLSFSKPSWLVSFNPTVFWSALSFWITLTSNLLNCLKWSAEPRQEWTNTKLGLAWCSLHVANYAVMRVVHLGGFDLIAEHQLLEDVDLVVKEHHGACRSDVVDLHCWQLAQLLRPMWTCRDASAKLEHFATSSPLESKVATVMRNVFFISSDVFGQLRVSQY